MSPSSITALMWLAGVAFPAYVISGERPSRRRIGIAFVVAGVLAVAFVAARRDRAQAVPAPPDRPSWGHEMLVGGAPIANDPDDAQMHTLPGLVAWLVIWAGLMEEPREERGPWILALIPLVLVAAVLAMGPIGPGAPAAAGGASTGLAIFIGVMVLYLAGVLLYWRLRRG